MKKETHQCVTMSDVKYSMFDAAAMSLKTYHILSYQEMLA